MYSLTRYFMLQFRPALNSVLTHLLFNDKRIRIGRNFRADGMPRFIVDPGCSLEIGHNVEFRRNVEIRVHGKAKVVIGDNCRIDRGVRILAANNSNILLGAGSRVGLYTVFNGGDSITVMNKTLISGFVYLQTSMHGHGDRNKFVQDQGYDHAPIVIEDDVWIGTHAVIMPGCHLQKGAVVGSNAVVTKNVDAYSVVAGVPARPLKERE